MKTHVRQYLLLAVAGLIVSILTGGSPVHAQTLAEALDTTNLAWTTGGNSVWFAETTNTYDGIDAAQSGIVYSNQTSWLETTVVGPATISYWSYTQTPFGGSFGWWFTINNPGPFYSATLIPLAPSWIQQVYDLGDGTNVLRWTVHGAAAGSEAGLVCLDEFTVSPPRPLAIVVQPADSTVYSGAQVWFAVSAIGTPPLRYQWLKGGTNISDATNSWLVLSETTTNDTDVYSVIVSNSHCSIVSSNALLTVLPPSPPFFTSEPESTTVYTGQNFNWWFSVDGSPPFTAVWQKGGTNVLEEMFPGPLGYDPYLTFTNISMADAGNYTLLVTNDYGCVASSNLLLTVVASVAPVITQQPRSLDVAEGVNTWMSVAATGVPDPWYIWFKEGATPPPSNPFSLPQPLTSNPHHSFNNVAPSNAGIYFATVSNYADSVTSEDALLTVLPAITNVGSSSQDAEGIFITNGLAYLARGTNGLAILDVSNPATPQLLGSCATAGYASAVRVSGQLAFVADGSAGLQIVSVTNLSAPAVIGGYATSGYAGDIAVRSNLVYLADGNAGLLIFNASNPASPTVIGSYSTNLSPAHIRLSGNLAYLTSLQPVQIIGGSNYWVGGMLVMDVSNPAQPAEIVHWGGSLGKVAVCGPLLFTGTSVVSLTNPVQPAVIGSLNYYSTNLASFLSSIDFQVVNDLVYMLASLNNQTQLIVFDVRDPSEPIPVGDCLVESNSSSIWVDGNSVYVAGDDAPLQILETPFNTNPVPAPSLSIPDRAEMKLQIQGRRGLHYSVEYTDQLNGAAWQVLPAILLTNDSEVIDVPAGPATRFFRLKQLD